MKLSTITILLILSFTFSNNLAQNIKAKLAGHQATNGFTVVDDEDKTLLKVTGDGDVGVNTDNPSGLVHIVGGPSNSANGKPIKIIAQDGNENGGFILLQGGKGGPVYAGDGAQIIVGGGDLSTDAGGGDINLISGDGPDRGGDINIETSSHFQFPGNNKPSEILSQVKAGDINIHTGGSNLRGGDIRIYTGPDNAGGTGIDIFTQGNENAFISLTTSSYGDITLTSGGDGDVIVNPNTGLLLLNGSGEHTGNWSHTSDKRYKKNIEPINHSLDKITNLKAVEYEWKKEEYPEKNFQEGKQIGLIAQDVEKVLPELVSTDNEGYKSIDYSKINVFLIEAIKEQQHSIEELKKEVAELKGKLANNVSFSSSSLD